METVELNEPSSTPSRPNETSVLVTNISPSANEKTVSEFFSFCGKIVHIKLHVYPNKASEAIIVFETEAAAKTAMLLTNALIADRPITVTQYREPTEKDSEKSQILPTDTNTIELSGDEIPNKPHAVPADQRTNTSVIASMLAAGYVLGADTIQKAREIDEQNQLSAKVAAAAAAAKEKVLEIDQQLKISETIAALGTNVANKAKEVDEAWKISENLSYGYNVVSSNIQAGVEKAKESPAVQTTANAATQLTQNIGNLISPSVEALKANVQDIKQQSNELIEQKMKSKQTNQEQ
jgi:hypothetical protein